MIPTAHGRTIRYTLEMYPDAVDAGRPVLNAWLCKGYDEAGKLVAMQCGNTAAQALQAAQVPHLFRIPDTPQRGTVLDECRKAAAVMLLALVVRLWPLRTTSDARVYEAISKLAAECAR